MKGRRKDNVELNKHINFSREGKKGNELYQDIWIEWQILIEKNKVRTKGYFY